MYTGHNHSQLKAGFSTTNKPLHIHNSSIINAAQHDKQFPDNTNVCSLTDRPGLPSTFSLSLNCGALIRLISTENLKQQIIIVSGQPAHALRSTRIRKGAGLDAPCTPQPDQDPTIIQHVQALVCLAVPRDAGWYPMYQKAHGDH